MEPVVILGCGFTGRRVARLLLARGVEVTATSRHPEALPALPGLHRVPLDVLEFDSLRTLPRFVPPGARVLLSIPSVRTGGGGLSDPTPRVMEALGRAPGRIVYLSTTGVYGRQHLVDETTAPHPETERERLRCEAERAVLETRGSGAPFVLRPAAIYGPFRGVHERMRRGEFLLAGEGANVVSRIFVDDLARLVAEALSCDVAGAYPAADEEPCESRELAAFCSRLLGLPMPDAAPLERLPETRRAHRRVDGRAVCRLLGVPLEYASYRTGIPEALRQETLYPNP
ncbi:MAG: NAD-dependent epimerase/dehydratase family protein [Bryobacteraceae bacterium]|nr:NAD-dependent epimerase/dehydratase family protein [Bryobacteraceae bacterium]